LSKHLLESQLNAASNIGFFFGGGSLTNNVFLSMLEAGCACQRSWIASFASMGQKWMSPHLDAFWSGTNQQPWLDLE